MLHKTMVLHFTGDTTATITSYQCKQSKSVNILSTLNKDVVIPEHNNRKRKPETVLFITRRSLCGYFGLNVQAVFSESY